MTKDATPWWGVVSSTAAPVLLIGGWTWAAARQEIEFDSLTQTISALAALDATDRWVMTAALTGVGLAHLVTAAALRSAALPGRVILAVGGVTTVLVATFPLPSVLGDGGSPAHSFVAGISFGALAVWPAFAMRRAGAGVGKRSFPWALRSKVALVATAALLAGVGWFISDLGQDMSRVGLSERVAAGGQALWPLVVVLNTRRPAATVSPSRGGPCAARPGRAGARPAGPR